MDNREIARAMGRSEGATKVLIHRAIKQLEGLVSQEGSQGREGSEGREGRKGRKGSGRRGDTDRQRGNEDRRE
jgi:RNA polymerase sigma-70 factor (ECF subfamily)